LRCSRGADKTGRVGPTAVAPVFWGGGGGGTVGAARAPQDPRAGYILSLGRIDIYQKGLDRLVGAFDLVAARLSGIRLVVAGGGTERQVAKLRSLIQSALYGERIEFVGAVERTEAAHLMKGCLMFAMPSRYEAWPLSALEAGAAGVPVVGSDIVGVRDAAPQYPQAHGVLAFGEDVHALADEMLRVATNESLRADIGRRGREWACTFTWHSLAEASFAFYKQVLSMQVLLGNQT